MVGGVFRGFLQCFCGFLVPFFSLPFVCLFYRHGGACAPNCPQLFQIPDYVKIHFIHLNH